MYIYFIFYIVYKRKVTGNSFNIKLRSLFLISNTSTALCHVSSGFVVIANSVAMCFWLCLEILHFDWLPSANEVAGR